MIAQSLGGHIVSNYRWDAQKEARQKAMTTSRGVWAQAPSSAPNANASDETAAEAADAGANDAFLRLKTLRFLYTTGCNIPIFLASLPEHKIVPVATEDYGYSFEWKNFFDDGDVLGWPLKPLSEAYGKTVCFDKRVNAGGLLTNWNPFSHGRYWADEGLLRELVADLESLLGQPSRNEEDS